MILMAISFPTLLSMLVMHKQITTHHHACIKHTLEKQSMQRSTTSQTIRFCTINSCIHNNTEEQNASYTCEEKNSLHLVLHKFWSLNLIHSCIKADQERVNNQNLNTLLAFISKYIFNKQLYYSKHFVHTMSYACGHRRTKTCANNCF